MIIKEYKTIFIHIPKNAGTSIEEYFMLRRTQLAIQHSRHDTIEQIKLKYPDIYNSYKKFAIIRNPYDRMVSWYFYTKNNVLKEINKGWKVVNFKCWLKDPSKLWNFKDPLSLLNCQCDWVDDTVSILKFENLSKDINNFFNTEIKLPVLNKTKHKHYLDYYDEESIELVNKKYKKDFKKYNYEKINI